MVGSATTGGVIASVGGSSMAAPAPTESAGVGSTSVSTGSRGTSPVVSDICDLERRKSERTHVGSLKRTPERSARLTSAQGRGQATLAVLDVCLVCPQRALLRRSGRPASSSGCTLASRVSARSRCAVVSQYGLGVRALVALTVLSTVAAPAAAALWAAGTRVVWGSPRRAPGTWRIRASRSFTPGPERLVAIRSAHIGQA